MDRIDKTINKAYRMMISERDASEIHIKIQERIANLASGIGIDLDDDQVSEITELLLYKHGDLYIDVPAGLGRDEFARLATPVIVDYFRENWKKKLQDLPETAMGSQHVDVVLKDGKVISDVIVFNGDEYKSNEPFELSQVKDVVLHKSVESPISDRDLEAEK